MNTMEFLFVFISTAVAGVYLTRYAIKLNIIDSPNYRKIHTKPIPKAGGLGFVLPVLLIMIWYNTIINDFQVKISDLIFFLTTIFLLILGILDDKYELNAKIKLIFQAFAAVLTVSVGMSFHLCGNYYVNYFISVVWIVGFINAMNLIDGLDGLAGGIGFIASAGILIFILQYLDKSMAITVVSLMGGLIGFLYWNRHPAKIFMGDTGSLPLGYMLAFLIIRTGNLIGGFGGAAISFFLVAIPIYDTLLSIVRRKLKHRPIFSPDRSHFYNLLMDRKGLSHKKTVYLIYAICTILVISALILNHIQLIYRYIFAIALLLAAVLASIKAGFLETDNKKEDNIK